MAVFTIFPISLLLGFGIVTTARPASLTVCEPKAHMLASVNTIVGSVDMTSGVAGSVLVGQTIL